MSTVLRFVGPLAVVSSTRMQCRIHLSTQPCLPTSHPALRMSVDQVQPVRPGGQAGADGASAHGGGHAAAPVVAENQEVGRRPSPGARAVLDDQPGDDHLADAEQLTVRSPLIADPPA